MNTPKDLAPFVKATESVYASNLKKMPTWVSELYRRSEPCPVAGY